MGSNLEGIARFDKVPVELEVELDRRSMPIRDVLALAPGSVIRFEKGAGSKAEVKAGGAPLGRGDVLVVNGRLAVRLTHLHEHKER